MKVGEITNAKLLGGWALKLEPANKLPQDVATAFGNLYGDKLGGSYIPIFYVGMQLVNGINHKLIVERTKLISGGKAVKDFSVVTINIPAGSVGGKGATIVSEEDATDFVLRDEIEKGFKKAMLDFVGAEHKPILELGTQIVKGTNYYFIAEQTLILATPQRHIVLIVVNEFEGKYTTVGIEQII